MHKMPLASFQEAPFAMPLRSAPAGRGRPPEIPPPRAGPHHTSISRNELWTPPTPSTPGSPQSGILKVVDAPADDRLLIDVSPAKAATTDGYNRARNQRR